MYFLSFALAKLINFTRRKDIKMDELSGILESLKSLIKTKLGSAKSIFDLWFGDLSLSSLDEKCAVFTTPSPLKKNILSTKYIDVIKETLFEIIGFSVDVIIEKEGPAEPKTPEKEITFDEEILIESEKREKKIEEILNNPSSDKKTVLDEYTFENFVEGSSNKFAKAACFAVANDPCVYNPLFIWGHSGLGKTHLLYAVMNHIKKNNPSLKIIYKKCETFMNELIDAIGNHETTPFKEKYRSADVLLIDDIQFISGKEATQEEFFHTFSALYESEKQIILTSDRPPMEIKQLTDRLRTRFEGGLIADVQPPSFELRTAIIRKKSDSMGLNVPNELVDYMAERLNNNIRQIEGVLKKLYAVSSLTGAEVTKESIDQIISIVDPGNVPTDTMVERILTSVSKKYGVSVEDIKSRKRNDTISNARHTAIYIIRKITNLSLKDIGKIFDRNHATIISSIDNISVNIRTVKNYEAELEKLIKEIKDI